MWGIDKSWTLFLDRDGVINHRIPGDYVKNPTEFKLVEGSEKAIAAANQLFGRVFVVTNQQGIGKGIMTERNLFEVHDYCDELLEKHNARIHSWYFAPQLKTENSSMRKPGPGMALRAQQDFPETDFSKSVMIGDTASDMEFGRQLGMKTIFVKTEIEPLSEADFVAENLSDAIQFLQS